MQIYLAVTPAEAQEASRFPLFPGPCGLLYRADSTLLRQNLLLQTGAGYCPSQTGARLYRQPGGCRPPRCGSAGGGATRRTAGFRAASCAGPAGLCGDAGPAPVAPPRLCAGVLRRGVRRHSLICTAISGGNFVQRLEAAAGRDRAGGLALDVQRLRMDFTLPAQSEGRLSAAPWNSRTCWTRSPLRFLLPGPVRPVFHLCPGRRDAFRPLRRRGHPFPRSCGPAGTWASPPPS